MEVGVAREEFSSNRNNPTGNDSEELKSISFLDSPEVVWGEPPVEQVLTHVGNVRNYHYYGAGRTLDDQDLSACLSQHGLSPNYNQKQVFIKRAHDRGLTIKPLVCRSQGGCRCGTLVPDISSLYEELPSDDHIRLLELLPGSDGPLECRMHISPFPDVEDTYHALSYTWDIYEPFYNRAKQEEQPKINCNGLNLPIGKNLYAALRRLRKEDDSTILWVDALCINQTNMVERSHQVQKMCAIFENAFQVFIWLGEVVTKPNKAPVPQYLSIAYQAFSGVCGIVNAWRERAQITGVVPVATHSPGVEPSPDGDSSDSLLSAASPLWFKIFDLYDCRWFQRVWVIQEAALARSAVVIWGQSEISWEWVGLAAAIIRTNFERIATVVRKNRGFYEEPPSRGLPVGVGNAYFIYRLSRSQTYSEPLQFSFHDLLKYTRQFGCKDDRDRVFGLLGLHTTDNINSDIIPDYTKSTGKVYFDVARKIIEKTRSLSLLSSVQLDHNNWYTKSYYNPRGKSIEKELPSWVPQWQFLLTQTLNLAQPDPIFSASRGRTVERKDTQNPRLLILRGLVVNKVETYSYGGSNSFWRGATRADLASGVVSDWETSSKAEAPDLHKIMNKFKKTRAELEEIAITLTAGKNWYGLPVHDVSAHLADYARCLLKEGLLWSLETKNLASQFHEIALVTPEEISDKTQLSSNDFVTKEELEAFSQGGNADRFLDAAATVCKRRALFKTDDGMLGVGPEAMREDDLVCILYGADVPFIIRREGTGYLLIGECYVRNLMRGEAVAKLSDPESKLVESWIELV